MKYIKQFCIILAVSFIGEILGRVIPFPIPASIYGLLLMLLCLMTGLIKLEKVKDTAMFLIEIMPLMFIPASVGLIDSFGVLKPILWQLIVITLTSTVLVMAVSGRVTQAIIRRGKRKRDGK